MALQTAYETPLAGAEAFFTSYFAALQTFELTPLMRHYASEVTAFEVIGQLSCEGRDAYEKHWRCCMEMCEDAFFEPGRRKMSVSENLAVVHGLIHCGTINAKRQQSSGQMRFTLVGQKRKGD